MNYRHPRPDQYLPSPLRHNRDGSGYELKSAVQGFGGLLRTWIIQKRQIGSSIASTITAEHPEKLPEKKLRDFSSLYVPMHRL